MSKIGWELFLFLLAILYGYFFFYPNGYALGQDFSSLDEIVVTGTRTERPLKDVPVATEVITRQEIEEKGAQNLAEVLEEETGLNLVESFAGKEVQLQGMDSKYVLVLIDGEPIIGRVNEVLDLEEIPLEMIDRIEIVKGPNSSLYGSEAMGGVVNIITRRAEAPFSFNFTPYFKQYGGDETENYSGSIGFKVKELGAFLTLARKSSDGFDMDSDRTSEGKAYDNHDYSAKIDWNFQERLRLTLTGQSFQNEDISKGSIFQDVTEPKRKNINLKVGYAPDDLSRITLTGYLSSYEHLFSKYKISSGFRTKREVTSQDMKKGEMQYKTLFMDRHLVNLGLEYFLEEIEADTIKGKRRDIDTWAFYAQDEFQVFEPLTLVLGGRFTKNSAFGSDISPKLSLFWRIKDDLRLRAAYGEGFRTPSFKELYINFDHREVGYRVEGNQDLKAEESKGYNLGLEYTWKDRFQTRIHLFRNDLEDAIESRKIGEDEDGINIFSRVNIGKTHTQGVELDFLWKMTQKWSFKAGYTYLEARDDEAHKDLLLRPRHSAHWMLRYNNTDWGFRANVRGEFIDRRPTEEEGEYAPGSVVWDMRIEKSLWDHFKLFFGIDNLFNKKDKEWGPKPGREYYGGFSLLF